MPARTRLALIAAATALLLIATAVVVWRVLRPSEVVTPAHIAYPTDTHPAPGVLGALAAAPLVLDDRIRIFAKKREVWSDGPASYHYERSAYWAYRRWPAQVTGVALVRPDQSGRPIVVTAWSDGELVGLDAERGTVAWRATGDALEDGFTGRRTGAITVYQPPGMFTSGASVVTVAGQLRAFDSQSGRQLWGVPSPITAQCRGIDFTTPTQLILQDTCAQKLRRIDLTTGSELVELQTTHVEPVSCSVGRSECTAMRTSHTGQTAGWTMTEGEPVPAASLAAAGSLPAGEVAVVPSDNALSAVNLATGEQRWAWAPAEGLSFQLLWADDSRILLLQSDRMLVTLNPVTGGLLLSTSVVMDREPDRPYDVDLWYLSGAYLVLQRSNPDVDSEANDDAYYFTHRPMLLTYAGRL